MPKRISGVSARLLECAKSEFLEKGFQDASIREIAKKADTSSRAVYTRFPNKEGLFDAIVGPATEKLIALYRDYGDTYWAEYQVATTMMIEPSSLGVGWSACSLPGMREVGICLPTGTPLMSRSSRLP